MNKLCAYMWEIVFPVDYVGVSIKIWHTPYLAHKDELWGDPSEFIRTTSFMVICPAMCNIT